MTVPGGSYYTQNQSCDQPQNYATESSNNLQSGQTGLSQKALGKLPATTSPAHSITTMVSGGSRSSVRTHTSGMSSDRVSQLTQEKLNMAMECAKLDDQVRNILMAKKPGIKKDHLRKIISSEGYRALLKDLTEYEKQFWTVSMVDLHQDYHNKQDLSGKIGDNYDKASRNIKGKGGKRLNKGVSPEQYDELMRLANDWEVACDK